MLSWAQSTSIRSSWIHNWNSLSGLSWDSADVLRYNLRLTVEILRVPGRTFWPSLIFHGSREPPWRRMPKTFHTHGSVCLVDPILFEITGRIAILTCVAIYDGHWWRVNLMLRLGRVKAIAPSGLGTERNVFPPAWAVGWRLYRQGQTKVSILLHT